MEPNTMQKEKTPTMHITAYVQAKQAGKQAVQQYVTCNDADGTNYECFRQVKMLPFVQL